MDYINYVKQSPMMGVIGYGGGATSLGRYSSGGGSGMNNFGTRGVFATGWNSNPGEIQQMGYQTISTTGNFSDFGDMQWGHRAGGCVSNTTRMVIGGGYSEVNADGDSMQNVIEYITVANTGNTTNFGDLTVRRYALSACGDGLRGCWGDGQSNSGYSKVIDYITIATTGDASDFGDTTDGQRAIWACADDTRGLFGGGNCSCDRIEYITINTTGNASDFGNMYQNGNGYQAASTGVEMTRGVYANGYDGSNNHTNHMGYVTIATTGNALDFGDMSMTTQGVGACTNDTRMLVGGGYNQNPVGYITVANTGNGTDFGDLDVDRWYTAASSGNTS